MVTKSALAPITYPWRGEVGPQGRVGVTSGQDKAEPVSPHPAVSRFRANRRPSPSRGGTA
jgi:hypothetical protein